MPSILASATSGGEEPTPTESAAAATDPYPPVRHASVLRFFSVEGDVDVDAIRTGLAKESTRAARCRVVSGPLRCPQRVARSFFAIEVPADLGVKSILLVLRRQSRGADELAWTAFQDPEPGPTGMKDWPPQIVLAGSSADLRWGDVLDDRHQFFHLPGKMSPSEIEERFDTLYGRSVQQQIGKVAVQSFTWPLRAPVDEGAARTAKRGISKLAGVREVEIDVAAAKVHVVVELAGLRTSGSPRADAEVAASAEMGSRPMPIRARFDTNPVLDLLAKQGLFAAENR